VGIAPDLTVVHQVERGAALVDDASLLGFQDSTLPDEQLQQFLLKAPAMRAYHKPAHAL